MKCAIRKSNDPVAQRAIRDVIKLEKEVWKAARERNATRFAELVPADGLMIFQSGVMTQADYIATMQQRSLEDPEITDMQGYVPNPKTVILIYKATRKGTYNGNPLPSAPVIECTTWIRRERRWVAILNQETPIAPS